MSDHELLRNYVRDGSAATFATLVERHVNLVYSAARRQIGTSPLAEDIAQLVFVELARCAAKIPPAQPLGAWLYVVTRRTAIDMMRRESRRVARETTAAEFATMQTPSESWAKVAASIDEAMATLSDGERNAVILRFFENRSLREVGEALGISDDTAQKRVSRALERLRGFLLRRGTAVASATLARDLSAHAIGSAPGGLAAAISSSGAASAAALAPLAAKTTHHLAMTTLQKSALAAAFTAAVGVCLFEGREIQRQNRALRAAETHRADLLAQVLPLRAARAAAARPEANRLPSSVPTLPDEMAEVLTAWRNRAAELKNVFVQLPEQRIPEIALLEENQWLELAKDAVLTESDTLDDTLRKVRFAAKGTFALRLQLALKKYLQTSGGTLPGQVTQLAPLFEPAIDPAILQRYEMAARGTADAASEFVVAEKLPVRAGDKRIFVGLEDGADSDDEAQKSLKRALQGYAAEHGGSPPGSGNLLDLLPYLPPAEQDEVRQWAEREMREAALRKKAGQQP